MAGRAAIRRRVRGLVRGNSPDQGGKLRRRRLLPQAIGVQNRVLGLQ